MVGLQNSSMRASTRAAREGFTLVELLLVLVILGTLAAIVIPKFTGRTEQAREAAAKTQLSILEGALDAYETDCGSYPQGNDGLNALRTQPSDVQGWRGPYLKQDIPLDPWGNAYGYVCPGKQNQNGYDIMSCGADGQAGTNDDINNWTTKTP